MDHAASSLKDLAALARSRSIGPDGASGRTSWVASASRAALVAALEANDAGVPLTLPLESSASASDAAEMLAKAIAMLSSSGGSLDEDRVRDIAREESVKASRGVVVTVQREGFPDVKVGRTHMIFPRVLEVVAAGLTPYLYGPPGTGKTHLAGQVAEALGLTFHADSFNEQTADYRIAGYKNAAGDFVPSPFYHAVTDPGLYLGDELDKANANVTGTLNMALSNGHASFAIGLVAKHERFRSIFAGNTVGLGATPQYPDRSVLPMDLRDRFVFVPMGVDTDLERELALAANPKAGAWVTFVQTVRERVESAALPLSASPRASIAGAKLLALGWSQDDTAQAVLWRHAPEAVIARAKGR